MSADHTTADDPRKEGGNGHATPPQVGKRRSNLAGACDLIGELEATFGLFTHNRMTGKIILERAPPWAEEHKRTDYPRPIDDADVIHCQRFLQNAGLKQLSEKAAFGAMLIHGYQRPFHPLQDYFNGLTWDGEPRINTWLSYYCGAEDSIYVREVGRMFLISMAARALQPGCQCDYVLVLEGRQGIGKSSLCRILGGQWFSASLPPIGNFKDAQSHLRGLLLAEVPELEAFSKADASLLKAFISTCIDRYRAPYGRSEIEVKRSCVFVMTTNESNYLTDHTGARRFWPVACTAIDLEALEHDRDQLLAEAVVRFKAGEQWWPDRAFEAEHIAPQQAARLEELPWRSAIAAWLEKQISPNTTVQEVFTLALNIQDLSKLNTPAARQIANVLRDLGWTKHKSNGRSLWRAPENRQGP